MVQQSGLHILDATLKVMKMNGPFRKIFHVTEQVIEDFNLQLNDHPFWTSDEIKNDLRNAVVSGAAINKPYIVDDGNREFHRLHITSKTIIGDDGAEKRILLVIKLQ